MRAIDRDAAADARNDIGRTGGRSAHVLDHKCPHAGCVRVAGQLDHVLTMDVGKQMRIGVDVDVDPAHHEFGDFPGVEAGSAHR
jgi:hypothetical protein